MSRTAPRLPPVWLAPGVVTDVEALARFVDLLDVPVCVGPVSADGTAVRSGRPQIHGVGVGGLDHEDAAALGPGAAEALLRWLNGRGLRACLSVRGSSGGQVAAVVERARRSVEGDVVSAIEVDLRTAGDQVVLRTMSRVREAAPRDMLLLARLAVDAPDLVTRARAAVAGGAGALVVCGQIALGGGRWWSGPSVAAHTLSGLRALHEAAEDHRWPGLPLIASGGIYGPASALDALRAGANAVQVGTALWSDPCLLTTIAEATSTRSAGDDEITGAGRTRPPERSST